VGPDLLTLLGVLLFLGGAAVAVVFEIGSRFNARLAGRRQWAYYGVLAAVVGLAMLSLLKR